MKLLLIDPPGPNKGLNTGLAYIAGALGAEGRDQVLVLDLNNRTPGRLGDPNYHAAGYTWLPELCHTLKSFAPDIVGVSVKTSTSVVASRIIDAVRQEQPALPVVVGGPHITLDGQRYMHETGAAIGVIGEGERSLFEICRAIEQETALEDIDGILYRRDGSIHATRPRAACRELDNLPFPDYHVFTSVQRIPSLLLDYPILTSRGCPFNCSYCSMPLLMGRRWRARSPQNVIAELRAAVEHIGATSFTVVDDNFTLDIKRAEAICDALIESGLKVPWSSQNGLRADRLTPSLVAKMRRSGCYFVWIGIETADEQVFASIDKGEKLEDIKSGIKTLQAAGIGVGGFFIIGLPGATRESDLKSLSFVKELGIEAWWFNFVPYKFTRAGDWVRRNATILRSPEAALQYGGARVEPVFETADYPREERVATYREVHVRMGYFDRLVDPNSGWLENVAFLARVVPRYGVGATLSLMRFLLARAYRRLLAVLGPLHSISAKANTLTAPKAASHSFAPKPIRPADGK